MKLLTQERNLYFRKIKVNFADTAYWFLLCLGRSETHNVLCLVFFL